MPQCNPLTAPRSLTPCALLLAMLLSACQSTPSKPNYDRPLPPGASALRELPPGRWPDLARPFRGRGERLITAINRSIHWFTAPSSRRFFPIADVTFQRARASVYAFKHILTHSASVEEFERKMRENFECYTSVGYDGEGTVLFTGYYTPIFRGSLTRTEQFKYPLYKRPDDLVTEPHTGKPIGRRVGDKIVPYPTRYEIETSNMLDGLELVYLNDPFDRYIIHVNGSAKIILRNGEVMYVGYAGKTDQPYYPVGRALVEEGRIEPGHLSLPAVRQFFRTHPRLVDDYIYRNKSYVFFTEYDGSSWPSGSLGFKVTPKRTLATDKQVFPRASVVLVETTIPTLGGRKVPFHQFMLDQDTGGAIRAAGRADIYMGIGADAARLAGYQFAEGRMYYFFLKPDKVEQWLERMDQPLP